MLQINIIGYNGECSHGPLEETERPWLNKDSPPMQALRDIVLDKKILKSFPFYTHFRYMINMGYLYGLIYILHVVQYMDFQQVSNMLFMYNLKTVYYISHNVF